jgi:antitoxin (DNA-binding transcriptional repressor) of toxin-antitoxin stability system
MTAAVNIRQAKAQLSQLISKACLGEEVILARGQRLVVKLVALPQESKEIQGDRVPGAWKGNISWTADAFDPLTDEELKDWGL